MLSLAAAVVLSCALPYGRATGYRYVQNPVEQRAILRANYPHLYNYYAEGVLEIVSMKEMIYPGGQKDWSIKHRFVRRYITDQRQQLRVLQHYYPDVYELVRRGAATVREMYEYVDTGSRIRYKVKWDRVRQYAPAPPPASPRVQPSQPSRRLDRPGQTSRSGRIRSR